MGAEVGLGTWLVPAIMGGIGAAGSALGGGAEGKLGGYGAGTGPKTYPTRLSVDPSLLGQILGPIEQIAGAAVGRARQPVTLPGAYVQPNPMYSGGGMPIPIGTTAVDPALQQPRLLGLPGINIGKGPLSGPYGGPTGTNVGFGTVEQPDAQLPQVAGGLPQLQGALQLLGVDSDPMGNLTAGGTALFTGATNNSDLPPHDHDPNRPGPRGDSCADIEETRRAECIDSGGTWTPGSPTSTSGGRPCGGYCQSSETPGPQ